MHYIIVGKGASGKDWLQKRMVRKGLRPMRQYTTREIRETEIGDEYHFISYDEYKAMEDRGKFISSNFYHTGWYAISMDELENSDVAILSPANVKDLFGKFPDFRSECMVVYLDIPLHVRRSRLAKRYTNRVGDDNERRIAADEQDFMDFSVFDIRLTTVESINNFAKSFQEIG